MSKRLILPPDIALKRATKDYLYVSRNKEKHSNYEQAEEMAWTRLMEAVEATKALNSDTATLSSNSSVSP